MRKDRFISVDCEADGPYPIDYSLLSVGAYCEVDGVGHSFYAEIKPISDNFIQQAVDVCKAGGIDREQLFATGVEPIVAMTDLTDWVLYVCGSEYRPVFVGFNAGFDWMFVNTYMHKFVGANVFGINAFDTKSFYMGKYNKERWAHTTKKNIPKRFFGPNKHTHNALDDAIEQYQLFTNIFQGEK